MRKVIPMPWERIIFDLPIKHEIIRELECYDMHVHSLYSDSHTKIKNIMKKAERLGIGVSITDHNHYKGSFELCKIYKKSIPGIEVTSQEGCHFLVYFYGRNELRDFYEKYIEKNKGKNPYLNTKVSMEKICKGVENFNGIIGIAHPFTLGMSSYANAVRLNAFKPESIKKFDFVEAFNGQNPLTWNLKSIKFAYETKLPIVGGSDGHMLYEVGRVLTCIKANSQNDFLKKMLNDKAIIIGKSIPIAKRIPPHILTMKRHTRYITPYITQKISSVVNGKLRRFKPKIS